MRFFLVAFVVAAAPALAQSLPGQQASRLVLLAGEEGAKAAIIPPPPPAIRPSFEAAEDPFTPIYRRMVSMQLQLLELQRASLAAPLTLTLIGGSGFVVGVAMLMLGAASYGFFIVGLIVLGVSSLPLLIGIPWLTSMTSANAKLTVEIDKLKREQRLLGAPGPVSSRPIEPVDGALLAAF